MTYKLILKSKASKYQYLEAFYDTYETFPDRYLIFHRYDDHNEVWLVQDFDSGSPYDRPEYRFKNKKEVLDFIKNK